MRVLRPQMEALWAHTAGATLFPHPPVLASRSRRETCPHCGATLKVYKSRSRSVVTLHIGAWGVQETLLHCNQCPAGTVSCSEALARLVPPRCSFGYDVLVYVGKALFQRYRTKADLFFAAMVPPTFEIQEHLKPAANEADLHKAIEKLSMAMLDYFRAAVPVMLPLMSHPAFEFEEFAARHPQSPLVALRRQIMEFFTTNRAPDPAGASLLMWGSLMSVAMFERFGAHRGDERARRRHVAQGQEGLQRPAVHAAATAQLQKRRQLGANVEHPVVQRMVERLHTERVAGNEELTRFAVERSKGKDAV